MFKKLQDWLFKEDYEELDIEEKDNYMDEVVFEEKRQRVEPKMKESVVYEEDIPYVKATAPKMNINIKVDDPVEEKKIEKPIAPIKSRTPLTRKDEYEMPPVISPYFGVKGEEVVHQEDASVSLNKINTGANKKEAFNSVISPFYGQKQSQKPIQQTTEKHEEVSKSPVPFLKADATDIQLVDENEYEEDNISLDEIVSSKNVNTDDLIQFSLFGEDKKIQEEEFDNEDIEKTEDDNVILPF